MTRPRQITGLGTLVIAATCVCVLRILVGPDEHLNITLAWPTGDAAALRFAALIGAVVVGVALAVSGVLLQALLRNPLASPFILGLSSGAGLGIMVAIYLGSVTGSTVLRAGNDIAPSVIGAILTLGVVYTLGRRRGWLDPLSLVLAGVVISAVCAALIMFFQHLVPHGLRGDLITWMMGHIPEAPDRVTLIVVSALAVIGLIVSMALGCAMDSATFGDDEAISVGVDLGKLRVILFLLAGTLAAGAVALAGPIGFVGLICPHAARLLVGPRHRILALASALAGVILLVGAEVARQAIDFGAGRMPVGIFTALIGGPAFLWLLRSGRGQA